QKLAIGNHKTHPRYRAMVLTDLDYYLEQNSQSALKYAWQICLSSYLAKGRVGDVRVDAAKTHIVPEVEAVNTEHNPYVLGNPKRPRHAQICIEQVWVAQSVGTQHRSVTVSE